jgi:hypothetical protein
MPAEHQEFVPQRMLLRHHIHVGFAGSDSQKLRAAGINAIARKGTGSLGVSASPLATRRPKTAVTCAHRRLAGGLSTFRRDAVPRTERS